MPESNTKRVDGRLKTSKMIENETKILEWKKLSLSISGELRQNDVNSCFVIWEPVTSQSRSMMHDLRSLRCQQSVFVEKLPNRV